MLLPSSTGRRVIPLMMEAASTTETSVNFYQTTRRNIPEASHFILAAQDPITGFYTELVKI
jgi:hypothetical protein